jgi:DNA-binding beta-propeller fold protein YncE
LDVIDPRTFRRMRTLRVGALPQHVTPSYDLSTLWVSDNVGNNLVPIDPRTARPRGSPVSVADPYNLYFTPDGKHAIVVAEALQRLDFRDPRTMRLERSLRVPCPGVNHLDFSVDADFLVASCEFGGALVKVDLHPPRVVGRLLLPAGGAKPQDVRLSADGSVMYVADGAANGLWEIDPRTLRILGFLPTGLGAHGLVVSRDGRLLYVSNRTDGSVSVVDGYRGRVLARWPIPGGSPDMGGVSADGRTLWLSGRYDAEVYAIDTHSGALRARIRVGQGPHGLSVWPQPGRYSLGHTGNMR